MVLSAFTSGERALVTTLASTPAPRPRPVGPLPPGGLLLIWAWTEAATSVASAVAGRTRRIWFMLSSLFQPRGRETGLARNVSARLRDTAYRSRALLSDRLHFNRSEPALRYSISIAIFP